METPFVAVFMVTYNHEKYIGQAIESVLMQKTTFPIKVFIGEDCSTDKTREICINYQKEHPENIELFLNDINLGAKNNAYQIYTACFFSSAKYIAMLEGDDYWTDPYKLQSQVDFLEANPEFSFTFSNAQIIYEQQNLRNKIETFEIPKQIIQLEDVIPRIRQAYFIPTATMLFRSIFIEKLPPFFYNTRSGDIALVIWLLTKGNAYAFNEKFAVYRKHEKGISESKVKTFSQILNLGNSYLVLYEGVNELTNSKYKREIDKEKAYIFWSFFKIHLKNLYLMKSALYFFKTVLVNPVLVKRQITKQKKNK